MSDTETGEPTVYDDSLQTQDLTEQIRAHLDSAAARGAPPAVLQEQTTVFSFSELAALREEQGPATLMLPTPVAPPTVERPAVESAAAVTVERMVIEPPTQFMPSPFASEPPARPVAAARRS